MMSRSRAGTPVIGLTPQGRCQGSRPGALLLTLSHPAEAPLNIQPGPAMHPRTAFLFIWLAAACGGGRMRVAQGEPENDTLVSLAPEPEGAPDSSLNSPPSVTASTPIQDTTPSEQGYAPYDSSARSTSLEIRRIGVWSHTGIREARRIVIQDVNAWAEFW